MFDKNLSEITAADIQSLVTNQKSEDRRLDYKEQFSIQTDAEKKEFLADVSSFANSSGGLIIFGIQEHRDPATKKPTGIPLGADGIEALNADAETLRLESIIRDGLSPRVSGITMKAVEGFSRGPVFLIRIPQSWNAPHMVTFQTRPVFFGRGNAGKFPMDVMQIRAGFTYSESLSQKIRQFHQDRVDKILSGKTGAQLSPGRRLVLHVIPLSALRGDLSLDASQIKQRESQLAPISSHGFGSRINLEGLFVYFSPSNGQPCLSYVQVYRTGIIEVVDTVVLGGLGGAKDRVPTITLEQNLIEASERYLQFLVSVGIEGPAVILSALSGVNGCGLGVHRGQFDFPGQSQREFDRDTVMLPETVVEDLGRPADVILKPIFDAFYNAAGWDKCAHYDANGRWRSPLR